ncbi:MAG: YmdB family metallophosphoesterase [Patescibacteria group bacterium]|nr:YmdB family metallophosphoesterase [Patescibacteria group bacterium]
MAKILFIGDIVGKPGRKVLREVLPQWREKYRPDAVIANVENLAHGKGVTLSTLKSLDDLNIDAYTSGNHVFDKYELAKECFEQYPQLIRPANYQSLKVNDRQVTVPGHGYYRFSKPVMCHCERVHPSEVIYYPDKIASSQARALAPRNDTADGEPGHYVNQQFLVLNLNATVFMQDQYSGEISNPFLAVNEVLSQQGQKGDIIVVDFHSEATSEKIALGWHLDGRVTAVLGTHTHVATADARVLPGGTAYISDAGMTGSRDSVLGVKKGNALTKFLDPNAKFKNEPEEEGVLAINGALIETDDKHRVVSIERLFQEITNTK